jgi:hypothetical protein
MTGPKLPALVLVQPTVTTPPTTTRLTHVHITHPTASGVLQSNTMEMVLCIDFESVRMAAIVNDKWSDLMLTRNQPSCTV